MFREIFLFLLEDIGEFFLRATYYPFYIFFIRYFLRKIHNIKIHITMFECYVLSGKYSSVLVFIEKFRKEIRVALMSEYKHMLFPFRFDFCEALNFPKYTLRKRRKCLDTREYLPFLSETIEIIDGNLFPC